MLLKSLELKGFKTFPDKTVLTFHNGITAVVGPNGSGKSNLCDAVRWVLGEQSARALRCTKMEDVIFGGAPGRKPLGFAEVTLEIDNAGRELPCDADTVSVTRRYYRSGESEYRINNNAVRLRDVNELFMDTGLGRDGYSMIGQGCIDGIVSARSEDRREIFEEAAGITRFRYRKEDAERRLAQAEENLVRLHDILSELEGRVGPLKEQAEKAKRYLALAEEKKRIEIGLWVAMLRKSGRVLREQDDKILIAKNQHDAAGQAVDALEGEIERAFQDSNACAARADAARRSAAGMEEEAAKKDGEISVLRNDMRHNGETAERLRGEIRQNSQMGGNLEKEIAEKNRQIEEKRKYIAARDAAFADCSEELEKLRGGVNETAGRIEGFSQKIAGLTAQAAQEKTAGTAAAASIAEIGLRLADIRKSGREKREREQSLAAQAEKLGHGLAQAQERIRTLGNAAEGHRMKLQARSERRKTAEKESEKLRLDLEERLRRARLLEDLERNLEGFSQSVKTVMREAGRGGLGGVRGPVSRLMRVPGKYALAMETALGGAMQDVVVESERDAKRAIAYLKRVGGGRATFLPMGTVRGRTLSAPGLSACAGFVGLAPQLCSFGEEYRGVVEFLLGRVAVAEDLDSAAAIAAKYGYRFRVVSLDGQVVNPGGSLTGGSRARNSGLLSRASEIEALRRQAGELRARAADAAAALKKAQEEESAAEADLTAASGELSSAKEERVRLDAECRRTQADLQTLRRDREALSAEEDAANARLADQQKIRQGAEEKSAALEGQAGRLRESLSAASGNREEMNRRCDALTGQIRKIELDRLAARKDVQSLESSVADIEEHRRGHREKIEALKKEIEELSASDRQLQEKIDGLSRRAQDLRAQAKRAAALVEELNGKRMALEKRTGELRTQEREKSEEKERAGHDLALLQERRANLQKEYDGIVAKLWEEYELTRREAERQAPENIGDPAQAKKRLNELKSEIRALGAVNVAAVEEYKQVSARYEFLKAQIADAEKSRDELNRLIHSLTRQMQDLFTQRFDQINRNFAETFRDLFGGGTGSLSLTDPNDVLGSGIEISVRLPGKTVSRLEALSGGEKALVAIALYFAIMKVNPPPFCVLDEIEAALDDVNVTRFASYLRKMNRNTQFIVITHRRGSMEEADVLYGVTMQDEGVSKLLEMPVAQLEAKLGIGRG